MNTKVKYLKKLKRLYLKGMLLNKIKPFDDNFYNKLNNTYINCLPVSMHIKYLKPTIPPGKCFDRSLYMFLCLEDSLLVRGDSKYLELTYGKEYSRHGWVELDNYVYDPSLLLKIEKKLYYDMYGIKNVIKYNKEEYCKEEVNKRFYNKIKNTKIEDFKRGGNKRLELGMIIPLIYGIAENSNNKEFINEVNSYLKQIEYNEEEIYDEIDKEFEKNISQKVHK